MPQNRLILLKIFRGLRPPAPHRGSAPGPRWGLRPRPLPKFTRRRFALPRSQAAYSGTARFARPLWVENVTEAL